MYYEKRSKEDADLIVDDLLKLLGGKCHCGKIFGPRRYVHYTSNLHSVGIYCDCKYNLSVCFNPVLKKMRGCSLVDEILVLFFSMVLLLMYFAIQNTNLHRRNLKCIKRIIELEDYQYISEQLNKGVEKL